MSLATVSIIVPIYKVEQYLNRCVDSILNQTYTNLEIILVNDGSPDNCDKICDQYKLLDKRIKVIHKTNGGLSSARNAGIEEASGEYLMFIDSDDWIDADMVDILHNAIKLTGAQIAECSYRSVYSDRIIEETICSGEYIIASNIEAIEGILDWKNFKVVAWNKLYHRDVISDIRYPIGRLHEDEFTTYKYFYNASKLVFVDVSKYNYDCARADSITKNIFTEKNLDACIALHERVQFFRIHNIKEIEEKNVNVYGWILLEKLFLAYLNRIKGKKVDEVLKATLEDIDYLNSSPIQKKYLNDIQLILKKGLAAYGKRRQLGENVYAKS